MNKRLVTIFIFLFFYSSIYSQISDSLFLNSARSPKKFRLAPIQIGGADYTDKNVISLLSGLIAGEEITVPGDKISEAIKKLWKQGLFEDIQIIQNKIIGNDLFLIIKVTERPRLTKFKFSGDIKKGEAEDLRPKINLMQERVVTDYTLGNIKNIVKDYYLDKGFFFTKINIIQTKDLD